MNSPSYNRIADNFSYVVTMGARAGMRLGGDGVGQASRSFISR